MPELTSIIILCHNQVAVTRLCLASLFKHTKLSYELIIIDNASTDGTLTTLSEFAQTAGPVRTIIQRNPTNVGYPAGVNQGLWLAQGSHVVLLNNDVVLTPNWLDRMLAWSEHSATIGLVGVMTNNAPPPQRLDLPYQQLPELDDVALRWQQQHWAEAVRVPRLTGFCLLVKAEVFAKIGQLDERFGLGFFDDDDLCLRARQAGYDLLLARDVYVHHFGSQTFKGLGIDIEAQLQQNHEQYRQKWGEAEASKYRLPEAKQPKVSLTMIVKNEERHLSDCLQSVADLVDEIIIVDTGSTDRTKEIARAFANVQIVDFPWINDFSAARNAALDHATGDWVFWMDADDRLDEPNRQKLRELFLQLNNDHIARVMKCYCVGDRPGTATTVDHVRLFRRLPGVRWKYRVHEQILPSVRATGGDVAWADITVTHVGYANPQARARKLDRDLQILRAEQEAQPDDPFTLFNLGSVLDERQEHSEALTCFEASLKRSHPKDSIVRKLYALIAQTNRKLNQVSAARESINAGRTQFPNDAELLFIDALLHQEENNLVGAEAAWRELLSGNDGDHFASIAEGLRGYRAHHNLAVLLNQQDRHSEAEHHWKQALQEQPHFIPAHIALIQLYSQQNRHDDRQTQLGQLANSSDEGQRIAWEIQGQALPKP